MSNRQKVSGPSWASSGPVSRPTWLWGWRQDKTVAVDAQPWGEAAEVPPGSKPRGTLRAIRTASSPRRDLAEPHRASAGWRWSSTRSVTVYRWTTSSAYMTVTHPCPRPGQADGGALRGGAHGAAVPDKRASRVPLHGPCVPCNDVLVCPGWSLCALSLAVQAGFTPGEHPSSWQRWALQKAAAGL